MPVTPTSAPPAEPVRPTYSELDVVDGLGTAPAVPRPVRAPIEVVRERRHLGFGWLVDVAIVAAFAVAAVFGARAARNAIFEHTRTFDASLHTGFGWWVARASVVGLVIAVCLVGALYLALFRRRGIAGRIIALLLLFALPVAAAAGAAYLVTRPASSVVPDASPADIPDIGAVPSPAAVVTAPPTSSPGVAPGPDGGGSSGFIEEVPVAPAPQPSGVQSQRQGTQHQGQ